MRCERELTWALGFLLLAASGGAALAADAGAKAPGAAPEAAPPPARPMAKIDWNAMDKKQRKDYMKKTVMPEMKKVFMEADAKRYKKMNCVTCHGAGANKDFKMPNPELPKLPVTEAGFKALSEKKPDVVKFMATKVKPNMAALLGMPEWTPQNQNGFGCYQCHTKEGEAAAKPAAPGAPAAAPAPKPAK
jgi:cytochrome c553